MDARASAMTKDSSKVLYELKKIVRHMRYELSIHTLNAADYGVPQRRRRVFIVGSLDDQKIDSPPPTHSKIPK